MQKRGLPEEEIAFALRLAETGRAVVDVVRKMEINERMFYRWKKQCAGMGVAELRKTEQLEEENRKLKQLVADPSLDKLVLQDVIRSSCKDRSSPRAGPVPVATGRTSLVRPANSELRPFGKPPPNAQ